MFKTSLKCSLALIIALAQGMILPIPEAQSQVSRDEIIDRVSWPKTDQDGFPESDSGSSGRGDCIVSTHEDDIPPVIALIPLGGSYEQYPHMGQATLNQPSIWFYIPYVTEGNVTGDFKIQDQNQTRNIFTTQFTLPQQTPGFIQVTVSEEHGDLVSPEYQEPYRWYFDLNCTTSDSSNRPRTPDSINGWINFVQSTPEIITQLEAAETTEEIMSVYRSHNIWYDWITVASTQGQESNEWQAVVQSRFENSEYFNLMKVAPIQGNVMTIRQSN